MVLNFNSDLLSQITTDKVLDVNAGLKQQTTAVISQSTNGARLHRDLIHGQLRFGDSTGFGNVVGGGSATLARKCNHALKAGHHSCACSLQNQRLTEQIDEAVAHQIGCHQIATARSSADGQIATAVTQHISRDQDATCFLAALLLSSTADFEFETSSTLCFLAVGMSQCVDCTDKGEFTFLLIGHADFGVLSANRLLLNAHLLQKGRTKIFQTAGVGDELLSHFDVLGALSKSHHFGHLLCLGLSGLSADSLNVEVLIHGVNSVGLTLHG